MARNGNRESWCDIEMEVHRSLLFARCCREIQLRVANFITCISQIPDCIILRLRCGTEGMQKHEMKLAALRETLDVVASEAYAYYSDVGLRGAESGNHDNNKNTSPCPCRTPARGLVSLRLRVRPVFRSSKGACLLRIESTC
jgi:hypothetical protein